MISSLKKEVLLLFSEGRSLYKNRKFKEAFEKFREAYTKDPDDTPSRIFMERCDYYIKNPPGEDWDGIYQMKTK